jgi:hypothetical protein
MASHGDLLAVLLFRAIAPKQVERNVALFDENGRERWRTTVPDDFLPGPGISNAFIGLGEHTVVVASRDRLVGWSVATGKRLG